MKYAVNEEGIAVMRDASGLIIEIIEDFKKTVDGIKSASSEYADVLGPHVSELNEALESIGNSIQQSTSPVSEIALTLSSIADAYEEIIDSSLGVSHYSDADGDGDSTHSIGAKVLR